MSRRYTKEEKQQVLERLIQNNGDVSRTSAETGVPKRTIYNWHKNMPMPMLQLPPIVPQDDDSPSHVERASGDGVSPDDIDTLRELQQRMLAHIHLINDAIPDAIAAAPLNQLVTSLSQMTDRYLKVSAQLQQQQQPTEMIITFEYADPKDNPTY